MHRAGSTSVTPPRDLVGGTALHCAASNAIRSTPARATTRHLSRPSMRERDRGRDNPPLDARARAVEEQILHSKSQSPCSGVSLPTAAWNWKGGAVMKRDSVLTVDEFLKECVVAPVHNRAPSPTARRVAIEEEKNLVHKIEIGCRCDRWGHPCANCQDRKLETNQKASSTNRGKWEILARRKIADSAIW